MRYRSDPTLPFVTNNSRYDEITIFQISNNDIYWIVFKSFIQINGKKKDFLFSFLNIFIKIVSHLNLVDRKMIVFI